VEIRSKKDLKSSPGSISSYLDLGLRLMLSLLIGVVGGRWVDDKLGTSPLFLLLGLFIGIAAGFLTVYRAVFPPQQHGPKP
jgi:F0F1-type ATP synthase assembly protein I